MSEMKELYTEDANNIASDAVELIITALEEFKLHADPEEVTSVVEDDLFTSIAESLSNLTINGYKNQMG